MEYFGISLLDADSTLFYLYRLAGWSINPPGHDNAHLNDFAPKGYIVNITIEELGPCKKLLRFELDQESVETAYETVTKQFLREVSLPGFRKGKAPKDMVLKQYETDINKEVKRKLMGDSYQKGVKEKNLDVIGYPEIEEVQFGRGQAFQYMATVETGPSFETPEYRGIPVQREIAKVADDDVDKAIESLRAPKADFKLIDRELREGDIAVINYKGSCEGKPINEHAPAAQGLTQKQGFWVEIKTDSFIPGFTDQLVGAKRGEKKTVEIDFPADFVTPQIAGKRGQYEVEIVEVRERELPELDDQFAKMYGADSMDALRKGVRQDLQNELNSRQRRHIRNQLVKGLSEKVDFELPESLVEQETRNVVYDIVHENQKRGVDKEIIDKNKDEIYAAAQQTAKERVKVGFLVHRISEQEGIRANESEVNSRIVALAQSYNMEPKAFVKELEKRKGLSDIYQQIIHEKVLDFLQQNAKIEDVLPNRGLGSDAEQSGQSA